MDKLLYKTANLELAAILNYLGFDIIGISGESTKQCFFLFNPSSDLEVAADRVRNRTAKEYYKVEPLDLLYIRKDLLQRLKENSYGTRDEN